MEMPVEADVEPEGATADERVYRAIYAAVQAQRLSPGVKLREMELTQLFKVSRTSVRSALLRLAHKGLVELTPNRGAVVAQPSAQDCRQLFEARRAVECTLVELLARSASPSTVDTLRRHVTAQRLAFQGGRKDEGYRLAISFHRVLAELAGNRILAGFLDDLLARMPLVILTLGPKREPSDATHAEHIDLVEAIAAGDALRARQIMDEHLRHVERELEDSPSRVGTTLAEMLKL